MVPEHKTRGEEDDMVSRVGKGRVIGDEFDAVVVLRGGRGGGKVEGAESVRCKLVLGEIDVAVAAGRGCSGFGGWWWW